MPYIRPSFDAAGSCISYFVCCPMSGVAAVIDPSKDTSQYVSWARAEGVIITHVVDTHIHADHVSGARKLVEELGGEAELHMGKGADVDFDYSPLQEGDRVEVGQAELQVMPTPGHTRESVSLLYLDKKRAPEPWGVFTGDTLFVGDIGRLDAWGHGTVEEACDSLRKLLSLPDYVEVYPAHFAGSDCASNNRLSFKTSSTVGFERRFNSMLQWDGLEQFEALLNADAVPIPPMWREIKLFNQGRGRKEIGIKA